MTTEKFTIQEWAQDERPREKFLEKGAESLSNAELIAILIRSGNRNEDAVELARRILNSAGNSLNGIKKMEYGDFRKFKGIGCGKALSIMAAFELARRCEMEHPIFQANIHSSEMAANIVIPLLRDLRHEECWILYLNKANKLVGKEKVSSGGMDATVVDVRIIIKNAIARECSHIILAHNHPSGSRRPGESDKIVTQKLKKAAMMCDIELVDHIIVAGNGYFSFADEGLL